MRLTWCWPRWDNHTAHIQKNVSARTVASCCTASHHGTSCRLVSHHIASHQGHITLSYFAFRQRGVTTKQSNDTVTQSRRNNTTAQHFLPRIIPPGCHFYYNLPMWESFFYFKSSGEERRFKQREQLFHFHHKYDTELCKRLMENENICSTETKHSLA